jgi:hypothetical protein
MCSPTRTIRRKHVCLTTAGQAARTQAVAQLAGGMAELAALASETELRDALGVMRRLRVWLDSHR